MPDAAAPAAKPSTPAIPENFRYSDHPHFAPPRASLPPDHPIHLDTETEGDSEHDVWIFGYGSLLFKVDFECEETKSGWVRGWRRVWWQGSIDHRGTEKYWGRVVTLVSEQHCSALPTPPTFIEPAYTCWGHAYRLPRDRKRRNAILDWLDFREKNGYGCVSLDMFEHKSETEGEEPILKGVLAYIALPSNPSFLGPGTVDEIAERIAKAEGPSGKNADYLFKVCDIVKENGIVDAELEALEERVRAILTRHG